MYGHPAALDRVRGDGECKASGEPSLLIRKAAQFGYALYAARSYIDRHGLPEEPMRSLAGHRLVGTAHPEQMAWNARLEQPAEVPLTVFPFVCNFAAVSAGLGLGFCACLVADGHPDLVRVSEVIQYWDVWVVTNPEARNNTRVRSVKEALMQLLEGASHSLSGRQ